MLGDLQTGSAFLGHVLRVPVFVHVSAFFMLGWAFLWAGQPPRTVTSVEWYIIVLLVLLVSLILHEIGHALAHRMFGTQGVVIYLTGFGGLCVSPRGSETVGRDMIVVAAGPFTNLVLAVFFQYSPSLLMSIDPGLLHTANGNLSLTLLFCMAAGYVNWGLFFVNIMPIYPLDGGRLVFGGSLLVTRDRLLSRKIALLASVLGAVLWFAWSTGLIGCMASGGAVGGWLNTLDGFDVLFAVMLFFLVRGAMQALG